MKDLLFISSPDQAVAADATISLPVILRRRGCAVESFGAGAIFKKPGYYKVSGSVTFTTPTAGAVAIELQKSGTAIPGISASVTTTGTTDIHTLTYTGVVRTYCGETLPVITLVNTGVAIAVTNATLEAEYYA